MTQQEFMQYRNKFLQDGGGMASVQLFNGLMDFGMKFIHRYEISYDQKRELLQIALIKAFENMSYYNANYMFTTWFGTILKNKVIDHLRSNKTSNSKNVVRIEFSSDGEKDFAPMSIPDSGSSPDGKLCAQEIHEILEKWIALEKSETKRRILEMYFLEGRGNSEIMKELNANKQMVNMSIHRFREKMKIQFNVLFNK